MRKWLTTKQETFCLKYLELPTATAAMIAAGYSPKYAHNNTPEVLHHPLVKARIKELRQKMEDATVMNGLERRQRLSEIGRARLTDFMVLGEDGSWVNLGPETKLTGAIQEIHSRTEYDDKGASPTVHTSVKLHNPIQAIDLLNKMDKIYSDNPPTNINNVVVFIIGKGYAEDRTVLPTDKQITG